MQKQFAALLLILTLGMVTVLKAGVQGVQPAQTTDISGPWVLSAVVLGEPLASRLIFKMDGEKLTGTGFGDLLIRGTLREANQLEFWLWTQSGRPIAAFKGRSKTASNQALLYLTASLAPGQPNGRLPVRPTRPAFTPSSPSGFIAPRHIRHLLPRWQ